MAPNVFSRFFYGETPRHCPSCGDAGENIKVQLTIEKEIRPGEFVKQRRRECKICKHPFMTSQPVDPGK